MNKGLVLFYSEQVLQFIDRFVEFDRKKVLLYQVAV